MIAVVMDKQKPKAAQTREKKRMGRPRVEDPQQAVTIRFDPNLLAELDAWEAEHGHIGRSAAVRLAVSNLVKGRAAEKES